jgi:AraC family transcriptional regulator of adaptative response/methylated-DNA-[protein]-cysteine methyltransferase
MKKDIKMVATCVNESRQNRGHVIDEDRWAAVVTRDSSRAGTFFYSVRTTGVYCRPGCSARQPKRENVRFHATCKGAEHAGFRPCKRCRPTEADKSEYGASMRFAFGESALGLFLVAASERGISAIQFGDDPDMSLRELQDRYPKLKFTADDRELAPAIAKIANFIEVPHRAFDLALDPNGTAFQKKVWRALCDIPLGTTESYADVAKRIGCPQGARAVAKACATNAIAVAIPCHRVVHSDGSLSGYRWGVDRKRALLDREAVA